MSVATFLKIKGVFFLKHFSGVTNVRLGQHGQLNASLGNVIWIGLRSGDTLESSVFESTSHMFGKSGRVFNEFSLLPWSYPNWTALPDTVSVKPCLQTQNFPIIKEHSVTHMLSFKRHLCPTFSVRLPRLPDQNALSTPNRYLFNVFILASNVFLILKTNDHHL